MAAVNTPSRRMVFFDVVLVAGIVALVLGAVMVAVLQDWANVPWYAASAVLIASAFFVRVRRPHHPLAVWFALLAASLPLQFVAVDALRWSIAQQESNWAVAGLTLLNSVMTALSVAAGVRIFIRFPDGRSRDTIERRTVTLVDVVLVTACALTLTTPTVAWPDFIVGAPVANPLRIPGISIDAAVVRSIFGATNVATFVALVLLVRRYRRSDHPTRQQIRWLLLPLVAAALAGAADLLLSPGHTGLLGMVIAIAALGVGIGLGIVGPSTVRADEVLRRSILWGLVWVGIASIYVGLSAALGITVGHRLSVGWTVTMIVALMLALQPVRTTLERIANRRIFGAPPNPRKAIARLGDSLAGTYDLETLLPEIASALEEGLGVEWAHVRLSSESGAGDRTPELVEPIVLDGETLGVVECGPKRSGSLDEGDAAVVATFARQAALAVRNVKLTTNLSERTAELAASRAHLLRVEEAERRKIERDIHDGVQQGLVALIGQAGLLRRRARLAHSDDHDLISDLDQLGTGLQRLLVELRELAAGIHPSVLRDRGLLAAVETLAARHPVAVEVSADPELRDMRLPIAIESAGYYTVAEALANSLKHAGASKATVELAYADQTVTICVADDGSGFDPGQAAGNGLVNLDSRVAAVEGRLIIDSELGRGTHITAQLPAAVQPT